MNLILAYYHLVDDWEDEHKASALIGSKALKRRVQKAFKNHPRQCRVIREELQNLSIYEKNGSTMTMSRPDVLAGLWQKSLSIEKITGQKN